MNPDVTVERAEFTRLWLITFGGIKNYQESKNTSCRLGEKVYWLKHFTETKLINGDKRSEAHEYGRNFPPHNFYTEIFERFSQILSL